MNRKQRRMLVLWYLLRSERYGVTFRITKRSRCTQSSDLTLMSFCPPCGIISGDVSYYLRREHIVDARWSWFNILSFLFHLPFIFCCNISQGDVLKKNLQGHHVLQGNYRALLKISPPILNMQHSHSNKGNFSACRTFVAVGKFSI